MQNNNLYTKKYQQALNTDFLNQLFDFQIKRSEETLYIHYLENNTREKILKELYTNFLDNTFEKISWSNGGTSNSYSGASYQISPDEEPEFDILDNFLENKYPNVTFLQYKKILKKITKDSYPSSDYYGGTQEMLSKTLSISSLHDALIQSNLLNSNKLTQPEDMLDILTNKVDEFILTLPVKKNRKNKP